MLANAYILHRYVPSTEHGYHQYVDFRTELAKQLIGNYNGRKVRRCHSSAICPSVPTLHFPMKAAKLSKCCHCYRKRKQLKWTQWKCQLCKKHLCHTGKPDSDCFLAFHNYQHYVVYTYTHSIVSSCYLRTKLCYTHFTLQISTRNTSEIKYPIYLLHNSH